MGVKKSSSTSWCLQSNEALSRCKELLLLTHIVPAVHHSYLHSTTAAHHTKG